MSEPMKPSPLLELYEEADKAFRTQNLLEIPDAELLRHLSALTNIRNTNDGTQHRDVIRALSINSVLMQRHIDRLERRGSMVQKIVIALTVAAIVTGSLQLVVAVRAEHRAAPFFSASK